MKVQALPLNRIQGVETGGCPHTAIREDASINLIAIEKMKKKIPNLDLILIESGGDNLAATFSPELVDLSIYVIDVAMGGDIPRKGGPAIQKSDLLAIYQREKKHLISAVKEGNSAYHIFSLSTINNQQPESRMVVLRKVNESPFRLFFNLDARSPKLNQLKNNKFCSTLFYDQSRRIQMRMKCSVDIHYNNDVTQRVWNNTALQSRKCYMGPYNPSCKLNKWHPNVPLQYIDKDPTTLKINENYIERQLNEIFDYMD